MSEEVKEIEAPHNPFNMPEEWTEETPWDIMHCMKCGNAWKVPSSLFDVWYELGFGCPHCADKGD